MTQPTAEFGQKLPPKEVKKKGAKPFVRTRWAFPAGPLCEFGGIGTLWPGDEALIERAAQQRLADAAKWTDRMGVPSIDSHRKGCRCEVIFYRWLGIEPVLESGTFAKPDAFGVYEIRSMTEKLGLPIHALRPEQNEPENVLTVGVVIDGTWGGYVRGWFDSAVARRVTGWYDDPGHRGRPGWFVPTKLLHPIVSMPGMRVPVK